LFREKSYGYGKKNVFNNIKGIAVVPIFIPLNLRKMICQDIKKEGSRQIKYHPRDYPKHGVLNNGQTLGISKFLVQIVKVINKDYNGFNADSEGIQIHMFCRSGCKKINNLE